MYLKLGYNITGQGKKLVCLCLRRPAFNLKTQTWKTNHTILLKKSLASPNFTTFLGNVLYKYTKNIFLNITLPWRFDSLSDTTINLCGRNILLTSVKMHFLVIPTF